MKPSTAVPPYFVTLHVRLLLSVTEYIARVNTEKAARGTSSGQHRPTTFTVYLQVPYFMRLQQCTRSLLPYTEYQG